MRANLWCKIDLLLFGLFADIHEIIVQYRLHLGDEKNARITLSDNFFLGKDSMDASNTKKHEFFLLKVNFTPALP
jgi:hypothetical protein